jgi:hypothetical protein
VHWSASVPRRFAGGSTPVPTPAQQTQLNEEDLMTAMSQETGNITGTQDKDYNLT